MKEQELEQFLIDYHPTNAIAEVDAQWLQEQLKTLAQYKKLIASQQHRIETLELVIGVYKCKYSQRIRLLV